MIGRFHKRSWSNPIEQEPESGVAKTDALVGSFVMQHTEMEAAKSGKILPELQVSFKEHQIQEELRKRSDR